MLRFAAEGRTLPGNLDSSNDGRSYEESNLVAISAEELIAVAGDLAEQVVDLLGATQLELAV